MSEYVFYSDPYREGNAPEYTVFLPVTGMTIVSFHIEGTRPQDKEMLKILETGSANS